MDTTTTTNQSFASNHSFNQNSFGQNSFSHSHSQEDDSLSVRSDRDDEYEGGPAFLIPRDFLVSLIRRQGCWKALQGLQLAIVGINVVGAKSKIPRDEEERRVWEALRRNAEEKSPPANKRKPLRDEIVSTILCREDDNLLKQILLGVSGSPSRSPDGKEGRGGSKDSVDGKNRRGSVASCASDSTAASSSSAVSSSGGVFESIKLHPNLGRSPKQRSRTSPEQELAVFLRELLYSTDLDGLDGAGGDGINNGINNGDGSNNINNPVSPDTNIGGLPLSENTSRSSASTGSTALSPSQRGAATGLKRAFHAAENLVCLREPTVLKLLLILLFEIDDNEARETTAALGIITDLISHPEEELRMAARAVIPLLAHMPLVKLQSKHGTTRKAARRLWLRVLRLKIVAPAQLTRMLLAAVDMVLPSLAFLWGQRGERQRGENRGGLIGIEGSGNGIASVGASSSSLGSVTSATGATGDGQQQQTNPDDDPENTGTAASVDHNNINNGLQNNGLQLPFPNRRDGFGFDSNQNPFNQLQLESNGGGQADSPDQALGTYTENLLRLVCVHCLAEQDEKEINLLTRRLWDALEKLTHPISLVLAGECLAVAVRRTKTKNHIDVSEAIMKEIMGSSTSTSPKNKLKKHGVKGLAREVVKNQISESREGPLPSLAKDTNDVELTPLISTLLGELREILFSEHDASVDWKSLDTPAHAYRRARDAARDKLRHQNTTVASRARERGERGQRGESRDGRDGNGRGESGGRGENGVSPDDANRPLKKLLAGEKLGRVGLTPRSPSGRLGSSRSISPRRAGGTALVQGRQGKTSDTPVKPSKSPPSSTRSPNKSPSPTKSPSKTSSSGRTGKIGSSSGNKDKLKKGTGFSAFSGSSCSPLRDPNLDKVVYLHTSGPDLESTGTLDKGT